MSNKNNLQIFLNKITLSAEFKLRWLYPYRKGKNPFQEKKIGVLAMILKCIWWRGSSSGNLGSVDSSNHYLYSQVHSDPE